MKNPVLRYFLAMLLLVPCFLWGQVEDTRLFSLLSSKDSGIDFENTLTDTKEHNILIYSNYYGGAGVGVGDFDNDGLQDIYFAGNLVGDRLYQNLGELKFRDVTEKSAIKDNGGWSSGVLIGDINNDGWQDIYVCRELYDNQPELRQNQLYINNGLSEDGEFPTFTESAEQWGVADDRRTRHAVFLDYNKDGHLDLFLLNQPPNPGNFSELYGIKPAPEYAPRLYRNNGNKSFTDVTAEAGVGKPGYPNSVTASDLNNDGWTDLYVANDFEAPDFLYINNGDGSFTDMLEHTLNHTSYFSMGVDAADINNDSWMDLMVVDMVAEDNFRLKANMSGMNPGAFWKVVDDGGHYQYMFNTLQLNQGAIDGQVRFSDIAQLARVPSTDWSWSNLFADFDNDGLKDIHITNGLLRDIRNTDADKKFSAHVEEVANDWIQDHPNAGEVTIWDILDLEKALEIVPSQKLPNYAFRNNGDLTFSKVADEWGLDQPTFSHGSAYADLDNDGDLDLVVNNVNERAFIYRNNLETNQVHHYFRVRLTDQKNRPLYGSRAKITTGGNDQWYEFTSVRGMYSTSENIAHFGLGNENTIEELVITWPDGSTTRKSNLKPDQEITIDRSESGSQSDKPEKVSLLLNKTTPLDLVHHENNFDDYAKQVLLPHKMSQFGPALAVGDVNGDGNEDFYLGGANGQPGILVTQDQKGNLVMQKSPVFEADAEYEDLDAAWFDADQDGDLDLYVVSGGNEWAPGAEQYRDRLYINDGKGGFNKSSDHPEINESGSCVRPYDFDRDGDLDLFIGGRHVPWSYPDPATSRLLQNNNGRFTDVTSNLAKDLFNLGLVTDAQWTDFDQDGWTDLVMVGEWMPLTFMRFDGKKFSNETRKFRVADSEGWWYSLTAEDLDNDGDQDLVAGNLGLNYKYQATPEEPFEVFYNDFDENGQKDIVLSYYNFGDRYPLRGRSCSAQQVPTLKYEFPTYTQFASASLMDVYGLDKLNPALHYEARSFASAIFINHGKGKFEMKPLPSQAQISSVNDILVLDINRDGHKDLLLAGNLFTSEIETTRNDAGIGILLLGNGLNEFNPVPALESGLVVPLDVKKMALLPSGDTPLILFGVNGGPVQFYSFSLPAGPTGMTIDE